MSGPRFPGSHIYLADLEMVIFTAIVGEGAIGCSISRQTLAKLFGQDPQKPLEAFTQNRPAIEKLAVKIIAQRRFEGGLAVIRACDS